MWREVAPEQFNLPDWGSFCPCCSSEAWREGLLPPHKSSLLSVGWRCPSCLSRSTLRLFPPGCRMHEADVLDHINRLTPYTPPPGSCHLRWNNRSTSKRSEAGRQRGKSTASFSSSAWEPRRGRPPWDIFQLQEGRLPFTVPHSLRSSNGLPSSSFGPKKRNSASLALSNFTYPPVVSLYPLEMIPLLSSIRSIVG